MRMSGKPVLVSIDTEGPCGCNFVDKLIWGRTMIVAHGPTGEASTV